MIEEDKSLDVMRGYNARTVGLSKGLMDNSLEVPLDPLGIETNLLEFHCPQL